MSEFENFCIWVYSPQTPDGDTTWLSGCGELHMFIDGCPEDNSYSFCPYCGDGIIQNDGDL